jgi:hypothetical protein
VITMADAAPGDVDAIVALYAELDEFYGAAGAHDALAERARRVRSALFSDPPAGAQSFYDSLGAEPLETKLFYRVTV